jgi:hypothetical protein
MDRLLPRDGRHLSPGLIRPARDPARPCTGRIPGDNVSTPDPAVPTDAPPEHERPRIGPDWAAVIVGLVLVLLALVHLLPTITFVVK